MIELRQLDVLAYPPGINILLLLAALMLWQRRRLSYALSLFSLLTLFVFSLPVTSQQLAVMIEKYPALSPDTLNPVQADAIVVLGGGMVGHADEYQQSSIVDDALMRLRYAAYLHRKTGLPILTTGGFTGKSKTRSEAETMQRLLTEEFMVGKVMVETESRTTYQNAAYSAAILNQLNLNRILLVTSSLHMNRAVELFQRQGLEVIPAPTDLYSNHEIKWQSFVPNGGALQDTRQVLHEYLGLLWYWLKAQLSPS